MKRILRITIIIIAAIGILLLGVFLLRNVILRYSLETVITNKTDGKINLDIEGVELILRTGEVFLIHPEFTFSNFYLNEAETRKLNSISFDSISVIQLSLKELLFDRKFNAAGLGAASPIACGGDLSVRVGAG